MYLSKLEIFGFKSFAQKVTFQFNDGITAIIGPNGCGKSNIVDAIRWALGEQRPTLLRLERMENLIFNGTATRKPLNFVEVSILIENTKNILPSIYSEVKIARRFYRSGESEYLINNRAVRLKDVIDLFTDTGMGSDAYSVIELKMVEQILSDNAEERRRLFEEAAGIKKYKFRRKSALRKLDSTDRELVRLNDVMTEVQKTVNSLSRQMGKARKYHQLKNDLKQNELYAYQIRANNYQEDLIPLQEEYEQIRQTRERLGKEVNTGEAELEKLQIRVVDLEGRFREISGRLHQADQEIREIQQTVQLNDQKIESINNNIKERKDDIVKLTIRVEELNQQHEILHTEREKRLTNLQAKESEQQKISEKHAKIEAELEAIRKKYHDFREQNLSKIGQINTNREEYQKISLESGSLKEQEQKLSEILNSIDGEIKSKSSVIENFKSELHHHQRGVESNSSKFTQLKALIQKIEDNTAALELEKNNLMGDLEKIKSRKEFLQGLIENYEGFSESIQYVMKHKDKYRGVVDTLANLVDTADEFRPALESYLEQIADFLIVEGVDTAREILEEVKHQGKGRLTLVPLSIVNNGHNGSVDLKSLGDRVILLKNVVKFDSKLEKLFNFLFDRVVLVDDMDAALENHKMHPSLKYVTRKGDFLGDWGMIRGGNSHQSINLTGRKNQFDVLIKRWKKLEKDLKLVEKKLNSNRDQMEKDRERLQELDQGIRMVQSRSSAVEQKLNEQMYEIKRLNESLSETQIESKTVSQKFHSLSSRQEELQPEMELADENLKNLNETESKLSIEFEAADQRFRKISQEMQQSQIEYLNVKNQLNELDQKIEFLNRTMIETQERVNQSNIDNKKYQADIDQIECDNSAHREKLNGLYTDRDKIEKEKLEVENNYQALKSLVLSREDEVKKLHRKWNHSLERLKEIEVRIQEIGIKQKTYREQYKEQFGKDLEQLLTEITVPENSNIVEMQEQIAQIRQRIESLGEVNPLAIKEYEKEKERLDFLKDQHADLIKAKTELLETISKLNKTAHQMFLETFDKINENFRNVFSKFFEGGSAEIRLLENGDPLEADIDISVHIKGKRLSTLNLLSGGEKTLTAISLLFAIYLYKPSPFCILDEVDAPLDDVNISRYTHALQEFSRNTQFILVTHNKMTMQAAQAMYGVTMEEAGVSKVVSVRFD
jgi:chromosome segregation protein